MNEYQFFMELTEVMDTISNSGIRKLNMAKVVDIIYLSRFASKRIQVSKKFATANSQGILMFYCLNVFPEDIYYFQEEEAIVIYRNPIID
ncbi:hypothetical protein J2S74_002557 [Evansella vedderi]|uniref:Uncharacterized protein n=1 Tax=Evansella vedderi TaxID=38282 RepID=A0ABT9ZYH9_9BACI|nr:hypothetical protein [Evansella vedderi]